MKHILTLASVLFLTIACSKEKKEAPVSASDATYSYVADSTQMTWTAYKFTERMGVSGTFNTVEIAGTKTASSVFAVFENATFSIPVKTVDSSNPDRDGKLLTYFFGKLKNTESITGAVESINADGSGSMKIMLNNKEKSVPFSLSENAGMITMRSEINLEDFLAQPAIESLNEVCNVLHTGADGLSKLWPDVALSLKVKVKQ